MPAVVMHQAALWRALYCSWQVVACCVAWAVPVHASLSVRHQRVVGRACKIGGRESGQRCVQLTMVRRSECSLGVHYARLGRIRQVVLAYRTVFVFEKYGSGTCGRAGCRATPEPHPVMLRVPRPTCFWHGTQILLAHVRSSALVIEAMIIQFW